jgi:hypothetical protein
VSGENRSAAGRRLFKKELLMQSCLCPRSEGELTGTRSEEFLTARIREDESAEK